MPRAFWKGVISFGLVAIPVKMYVGTESKTLSFHLLHKKCLTRPRQVLYCETDNEHFGMKETVRGYEVAKDQYVVLDESDFNKVPIKTSHAIEILGFVEAKEIDPIYYYGSHYVEPEELGAKPFWLLRDALQKTGRVGMAISLVKAMAKNFNPGDYKDEYREALKKVVEAKISGEKMVAPVMPKVE